MRQNKAQRKGIASLQKQDKVNLRIHLPVKLGWHQLTHVSLDLFGTGVENFLR